MKMRDVCVALIGGSVIYVAMAACSAVGQSGGDAVGGGAPTGGKGGAAQQSSGMTGPIVDPVPNASADPVSGTRLKARLRTTEDGAKEYLPFAWYDSKLQTDCNFMMAADGKERCLPTASASVAGYFADLACSEALAVSNVGCAAKYAARYEAQACVTTMHVYQTGAPETPAKVYTKSGNSCVDVGAPNPAYYYYKIGPETPPASFVAGTVEHE